MPSLEWPEDLGEFDSDTQAYFHYHKSRYEFLLERSAESVARLYGNGSRELRILDIGLSFESRMLQRQFPDCVVNTLGLPDQRFQGGVRGEHFVVDLNSVNDPALWPQLPVHDFALMAEVIEHVFAPPAKVLACVASWLRPEGELLLQTPNAVSLGKRWQMLRGRHPYMMLREPVDHSGHIREYTLAELIEAGKAAGLTAIGHWIRNYFQHISRRGSVYRAICDLLPQSCRDGITVCFRKTLSNVLDQSSRSKKRHEVSAFFFQR